MTPRRRKKRLIEQAYEQAEAAGIVQLNEDEAGPYQAIPQPGASWQPEGHPALQPHEYERGGTAKLLTLFRPVTGEIRAFIASTMIWDEVFLPLAAAGFRVVALDLPGYGYSDKPRHAEYTIESQARAVVGLMDQLGIEQAGLVGASYGGAIAAAIALDHPERVSRLVLVGAVSSDEPKKKLLLRMVRLPLVGDIVTPLFLGSRWVVRKRMEDVYQRLRMPVDQHKIDARHHLLATADTHRAMIRTVRRWSAKRIARDAHLIRQPTMLMWGEG